MKIIKRNKQVLITEDKETKTAKELADFESLVDETLESCDQYGGNVSNKEAKGLLNKLSTEKNESLTEADNAEDLEDLEDPEEIVVQDSEKAIADATVDQVETASKGEETLSDESAAEVAGEVKSAGTEIGAENAVIAPPVEKNVVLGTENIITRTLDKCLRTARKNQRRRDKINSNLLIVSLPGFGKTATVKDWCYANGLNLVELNAKNNDLNAYINGYTARGQDENGKLTNQVQQLRSTNLDGLNKPNSVLFVDEYNRQTDPGVRAALLTLINEHTIFVGNGGDGNKKNTHTFENLLFTIACINPSVRSDRGAAPLNDAERTRFKYILDLDELNAEQINNGETPAYIEAQLDYINKFAEYHIADLDKNSPDFKADLEDYLRERDLATYILKHPDFRFDNRDALDTALEEERKLLNARSFTEMLYGSGGDPKVILSDLPSLRFLKETEAILKDILEDYTMPTFEELCRKYKVVLTDIPGAEEVAQKTEAEAETAEPTSAETEDDDLDLDKDSELFNGTIGASTSNNASVMSPQQAKQKIIDVISKWA